MFMSGAFFSKTLEMDTGVTFIMPNDVLPEGGYKVAYVLHGLGGNHNSWANYSLLPAYAAHGKTIYVLPEVGRSFYSDMRYGGKYFTYVTEELPALCRSLFSISSRREDTVVMGNSMGGFGALLCALNRPDVYGKCGAFSSPCLFLAEAMAAYRGASEEGKAKFVEEYGERLRDDFVCVLGEELVCGEKSDVQGLVRRVEGMGEKPELYCTCGDSDPFTGENRRFGEVMRGVGIPFEYEEWAGEHNFDFFNCSLKKAIERFGL